MKRFTQDNFTGCLLGGAIGDALGYPVQFKSADEIRVIYGYSGIKDFSTLKEARISVNTQMTLFTANGLIYTDAAAKRGEDTHILENLHAAYVDWLRTQSVKSIPAVRPVSWLLSVSRLRESRTPEQTCLDALSRSRPGTIQEPVNDNKSCGAVTRSAPIGLYWPYPLETVQLAAQAAAITHGNPMGYITAGVFAYIITKIIYSDKELADIILDSVKMLKGQFPENPREIIRITELLTLAVKLIDFDKADDAERMTTDSINIKRLGRGRVAEEALAIAVYCCLKYQEDFERAVAAAVNHSGDSDTTGSMAGNILGALNGASCLPEEFTERLELRDIISEIGADLYDACSSDYDGERDAAWNDKYGSYRL